jgi:hypothetical protein
MKPIANAAGGFDMGNSNKEHFSVCFFSLDAKDPNGPPEIITSVPNAEVRVFFGEKEIIVSKEGLTWRKWDEDVVTDEGYDYWNELFPEENEEGGQDE